MDADAPPRTEQTPADGAIEAAAEDVVRRRANRCNQRLPSVVVEAPSSTVRMLDEVSDAGAE